MGSKRYEFPAATAVPDSLIRNNGNRELSRFGHYLTQAILGSPYLDLLAGGVVSELNRGVLPAADLRSGWVCRPRHSCACERRLGGDPAN